ncbi:MAG: hypothetical protein ACO4CS_18800, partial [bacterium]
VFSAPCLLVRCVLRRESRMNSPFADKNSIKSNLNLVLLADFFHAYQRTNQVHWIHRPFRISVAKLSILSVPVASSPEYRFPSSR